MSDYARYKAALHGQDLPTAFLDLDAFEHNIDFVAGQLAANDVTLRVASKSVRHVDVLRRILDRGGERFVGLMTFTARESAFLVEQGFDDLLIAYPFATAAEAGVVAELAAQGKQVIATVDHPDQVALVGKAAVERGVTVPLCLDVDMSWRPFGMHLGVRRSPIRGAADAMVPARAIADTDGVELVAVLAYEAQVAGMRDVNPGSRAMDPIRQVIKRRSKPLATSRRNEVVQALRDAGHAIRIVNGGGTGSVAFTSGDGSVTEVTAGSGFYCPHLFSGYDGLTLRPAAMFALAVVRSSDDTFVTCGGGGYVASGEAGKSRLPEVYLPEGLAVVDLEGFGEVQTPLEWKGRGSKPSIGDPIICRHAKAGELLERFSDLLYVRGDAVVGREPSYRGMGQCFL